MNSQLRKARSIDSACLENQPVGQEITVDIKQHPLVKTKSEYNINGSTLSLHRSKYLFINIRMCCSDFLFFLNKIYLNIFTVIVEENKTGTLQKSKTGTAGELWESKYLVRALYSYLSNGENQLSFLKGDTLSAFGIIFV